MGRKARTTRIVPEQDRRICATICVCQLTAVLSCVALVYLSVAIYMPAKKALQSGYETRPALCQTRQTDRNSHNCSWSSCGEWCLTKSGPPCPQIQVIVRRNGTNIRLENCSRAMIVACPPVEVEELDRLNCNTDGECERISGIFGCKRGHCANISEILNCRPNADGAFIDAEKDNLKLNGYFQCERSRCRQIKKWPFPCDRICRNITTAGANVLLLHGDAVMAAECSRALRINTTLVPSENATEEDEGETAMVEEVTETLVWTPEKGILMAACLSAERSPPQVGQVVPNITVFADDCINGTVVSESRIPSPFMNFTYLWSLFEEAQAIRVNDTSLVDLPPPQQDLVIYNSSRLLINLEGCVNTLRGECNEFVKTHGQDGTNHSSQSRFQCFYHASDPKIVLARHNLHRTWLELVIAAGLPGGLLVLSCCSLCICTRVIRVGDDAKMRCHPRGCLCCCCCCRCQKRKKHESESEPAE